MRTGVTAILPRGRATLEKPVFAGCVQPERQRRDDRHALDRRVRLPRRPGDDHRHAQRRHGARCRDRVAHQARQAGPERLLVVAARRRGDVGRRPERRERLSRESRARVRCAGRRARRRARRRQRRRRHGDDLPRVQMRHRHELARRGDRGAALHGRRAGAGELRRAQRAADRRRAGRQVHAGERRPSRRTRARSSSSSRPTRRSCRSS